MASRDQEPVGRRPRASAEHRRERVVLRQGQPLEMVEHGRAELMEAAVGQLHFRLDADGSRDPPASDVIGQIAQQRALAHTGFPSQHDRPTPTGKHASDQRVERLKLVTTTDQPRGADFDFSGQRRLRNVSKWSAPLNNGRPRERGRSIAVPDSASPAASRLRNCSILQRGRLRLGPWLPGRPRRDSYVTTGKRRLHRGDESHGLGPRGRRSGGGRPPSDGRRCLVGVLDASLVKVSPS